MQNTTVWETLSVRPLVHYVFFFNGIWVNSSKFQWIKKHYWLSFGYVFVTAQNAWFKAAPNLKVLNVPYCTLVCFLSPGITLSPCNLIMQVFHCLESRSRWNQNLMRNWRYIELCHTFGTCFLFTLVIVHSARRRWFFHYITNLPCQTVFLIDFRETE